MQAYTQRGQSRRSAVGAASRSSQRPVVVMAATAKVGGKNITFSKYQGLGNDFILVSGAHTAA